MNITPIFDRLHEAERVVGEETRIFVGQAVDRLIRDRNGDLTDHGPGELRRRALATAWVVDPTAFGGRSLAMVLREE